MKKIFIFLLFLTFRSPCVGAQLYNLTKDFYPVYAQEFVEILPDIHELINRSYKSTKKDKDRNFIDRTPLQQDQTFLTNNTNHCWMCLKNFTGKRGCCYKKQFIKHIFQKLSSIASVILTDNPTSINLQGTESLDYPGFVAIFDRNTPGSTIWIAIVFRGTQSSHDSVLESILKDDDWRTNLSITPAKTDSELFGFSGDVHSGYLLKLKTCIPSLLSSIERAIESIPSNRRSDIKFIICGHSQGGALAQLFYPALVKSEIFAICGMRTPEMICYSVSPPPFIVNQKTLNDYHCTVDRYSVISHIVPGDVVPVASGENFLTPGTTAIESPYDLFLCAGFVECIYSARRNTLKRLQSGFDNGYFEDHRGTWVLKSDPRIKIFWDKIFSEIILSDTNFHKLVSNPQTELFRLIRLTNNELDDVQYNEICTRYHGQILNNFDLADRLYENFLDDTNLQDLLKNISNKSLKHYKENLRASNGLRKLIKVGAHTSFLSKFDQLPLKKYIKNIKYLFGLESDFPFLWSGNSSAIISYYHIGTRCGLDPKVLFFDPNIISTNINSCIEAHYRLAQ